MKSYVIITPARNEETFIERTINSMVAQTVRPIKWVIVDDGSTDRTAQIAKNSAKRFEFIQLIKLQNNADRNFACKAHAFNTGMKEVQNLNFDFVGNIDADMSFGRTYFENILKEFESDSKLGISGGIVYTKFTRRFVTYDTTSDSVGGKVQLFRRECFESIGGYLPLKLGGIDTAAEIMARMKGWTVRKSFKDRTFEHRRTSFAWGSPVMAKIREGSHFYSLGYDHLFFILRCIYRLKEYPFIIGSGAALFGYINSMIRQHPIVLPTEVVSYLKSEQRAKLKRAFHFQMGCQTV
jgi:glycosyltransferase involved in cell wall biosynthesis